MSRFDDANKAPASDEATLLYWFGKYQRAADELLRGLDFYNRQGDPVTLFAEHLVASRLDGCLADHPNQEGWDLRWADGRRVQVRTLRNESQNDWKNGIDIVFERDVDDFVCVFFFGRKPSWCLRVPKESYRWLRGELKARNKKDKSRFELTETRWHRIKNEQELFKSHDVILESIQSVG